MSTLASEAAPGRIAAAVWEGRRYAEELDEPTHRDDTVPFRRGVTQLGQSVDRRRPHGGLPSSGRRP